MNALVPTRPAAGLTFEFEGEAFRTSDMGGEPIFRATDVARALGYRDAGNLARNLDPDETTTHNVSGGFGEDREVLYITEPGLYRAIMLRRTGKKIHPEIAARIARFQRWATHEVIPSIRRTGSYAVPGSQPVSASAYLETLKDPGTLIALAAYHAEQTLLARAETEAERQAHAETHQHLEDTARTLHRTDRALVVAQEELAEQAPVVAAMRRFRDTGRAENLRTLPRILDAGEREVFAWLKDRGYLFKQGGWLQPRADLRLRRYPVFIVRQVTCDDEKIRWQTMVTPTGQVWLHQRWEARQLIIARNAAREAERARDENIARGLFD